MADLKLDHEFLAVYRIEDFDPRFVTFRKFIEYRQNEFRDLDAAWIFWYLNENRDPARAPEVLDYYPDGYIALPGTLLSINDPDFIPKDEYILLSGAGQTEDQIREGWFQVNLFSGSNKNEITFLVNCRQRV